MTKVSAKFTFEKIQKIKFLMKDGVEDGNEIGSIETTMSEIVMADDG